MPAFDTSTIIETTVIASGAAQTDQVSGWNIFWCTASLTLACVTHPINSGLFFIPEDRHMLHLNPGFSLLDAVVLVMEVGKEVWRTRGHLLEACTTVSASLRKANGEPFLQDRRIRAILAIIFVFQYVKVWGYRGLDFHLHLWTAVFGCWALMEMVYILGSFHSSPRTQDPTDGSHGIDNPPRLSKQAIYLSVAGSSMYLDLYFMSYIQLTSKSQILPLVGVLIFIPCLVILVLVAFLLFVTTFMFYFFTLEIVSFAWPGVHSSFPSPESINPVRGMNTAFVVVHISALACYCLVSHDPEGTSKSGWSENLP